MPKWSGQGRERSASPSPDPTVNLSAILNEDGLEVNGAMILFYRPLAATFLHRGKTPGEGKGHN